MVDGMSKGKRRHALPKRWFLGDVVKKVGAGRRVAGIHLRLVVFYSAGGVLPTTSPRLVLCSSLCYFLSYQVKKS